MARGAIALLLAVTFSSPALAAELSPEHRRWLEEEVVYIITPREKEVFEQLGTYEERERFIEAFWKRRDPNPATPENEFKTEHYRRIAYANQWLGRETHVPGWKTDRGRIYILLGEPLQRQTFDDMDDIVPSELWFYQAPEGSGLPPHFYVLFYQRNLVGEYRLYSPVADGPDRLVRGMTALAADTRQTLQTLKLASPELAQASLSLDPNEPVDFSNPRGSLTSGLIVNRIEQVPFRNVKTDYIDAYLAYGNRVSADYSFNYVPSRGAVAVLVGPQKTPFVHYGLELDPSDFSLEADEQETRFYTTLDVSLEIRTPDGRLVDATDKEVYLELTRSQMQAIERAPIAYQDDLPLVPGEYRLSVVLRNRVSKQYTVLERDVDVPDFEGDAPVLSGLAVGYEADPAGAAEEVLRPFQVGGTRIEPAADGVFAIADTLHVAATALRAPEDAKVRLRLASDTVEIASRERPVSDYGHGEIHEALSLEGAEGGRYDLSVSLVGPSGETLSERHSEITVSPRSTIPRAGIVRRSAFAAQVPGQLELARGNQLMQLGRFDEAVAALEKAIVPDNPSLPMAKWQLATALLETGEPVWARKLLRSLEPDHPNQFEVIAGLGFAAYQTGDFASAVTYLERAQTLRPATSALLNALGASQEKLGHPGEARKLYERSLELEPDQPPVQARLDALK